ncbi:hypothetical protein Pmani_017558 [Petrolisthes manimaculis]|uniref:Uncharacterized protein n=1 Tax=Petrolisthes manimaculis TaxID=1843537 RepID=A0AAE1U7N1_9EUCA|nr:hypothetical protein Pmani_017558 [Petrolisthes manimaculis]
MGGTDRRKYRDSYIYGERYGGGLTDSMGGLRGYLGKGVTEQRESVISSTSSNTTSGIVSDRVLSIDGSEDDLDSDLISTPAVAASIESGVESLTLSLSRLDSSASSSHPNTPDYDDDSSLSHPSFTPPSSSPPTGGRLSGCMGVCGSDAGGVSLGRAGSVHSSSSQHSASTVRSRYSLVPHHRPELTLGADLSTIAPARDLPHLADLPSMVADRPGDEQSDLCSGMSHTQHNCCSTCCDDDNASITSTDDPDDDDDDNDHNDDDDDDDGHCKCGSCAMCILKQASSGFLHRKLDSESSSMAAQRGDTGPHTYNDSLDSASTSDNFFGSSTFASDDVSVMVQPDLDDSVTSTYNFSEEDFSQLDNNDDYVEFFKDGLRFPDPGEESLEQPDPEEDRSLTPPSAPHRHSPQGLGAQGLVSQAGASGSGGASPTRSDTQEDEHLDYSVESAQASLLASYSTALPIPFSAYRSRASVSSTFDTDSDYVQVSGTDDPFLSIPPAPASMSTVTTITPVNIVSSHPNIITSKSYNRNNESSSNRSSLTSPDPVISEAVVANASEAPAKFITSNPRITVFKAHTQRAATAAPSFASFPFSRGLNTLPQVQPRPKIGPIQSLQRPATQLPEGRTLGLPPPYSRDRGSSKIKPGGHNPMEVPVIRKNNYLDLRASAINKRGTRMHPEQHPTVTPRSLYLRHQQKALQQWQLKQQQHMQMLQQRQSSETVYQPAAYAQVVGVPLLPSPTYTGYHQHQPQQQSAIQQLPTYITHQQQQQQQQQSQSQQQYHHHHQQQQYQQQQPQQPQAPQANYLYPPYIKNFFQNPPPPSPHLGYGVGVGGSGGSGFHVALEAPSPPYQCASDPDTYSPQQQHQQQQQQQQQSLATVYTNQVNLSQIEQYKAQLYSDVDYVIYPMKDPALSRQEYMDAKQGQVIASEAQQPQASSSSSNSSSFAYLPPPPPYRSPKLSPLYRSTPNVAATLGGNSGLAASGGSPSLLSSYPSYQSLTSHQPGSSSGYSSMARGRCFSQQSLASSSLSSAPSGYSASTQSLTGSYEPYSEVMMLRASSMMRVRSDESILSSALTDNPEPQVTTDHPLPPPPPYRPKVRTTHKYVASQCCA